MAVEDQFEVSAPDRRAAVLSPVSVLRVDQWEQVRREIALCGPIARRAVKADQGQRAVRRQINDR